MCWVSIYSQKQTSDEEGWTPLRSISRVESVCGYRKRRGDFTKPGSTDGLRFVFPDVWISLCAELSTDWLYVRRCLWISAGRHYIFSAEYITAPGSRIITLDQWCSVSVLENHFTLCFMHKHTWILMKVSAPRAPESLTNRAGRYLKHAGLQPPGLDTSAVH